MQTPPKQNSIMPLITELLHFFCLKTIKTFLREDTITAETKKGERGWLIKSVGLGLQVCNDRGVRCVEVKEIREVPMERPCVPPSAGLTPREPPSRRSLSRLIKHLLCCYNSDGYGCRVHWLPRRQPLTSLASAQKQEVHLCLSAFVQLFVEAVTNELFNEIKICFYYHHLGPSICSVTQSQYQQRPCWCDIV